MARFKKRALVKDPLSNVETWKMNSGAHGLLKPGKLQIIAVTKGEIEIQGGAATINLSTGQFSLIPAILDRTEITAKSDAALLRVEAN